MAEQQDTNRFQAPPQHTPAGGPIRTEHRAPAVEGVGVREAYTPYTQRESEGYYSYGARTQARVSWGALFAGFFAAIVVQALLLTLGVAVGLTATGQPTQAFGPGMGIWWVITSIVALFLGGWVAARLMHVQSQEAGAMHGFLTWAITTVLGTLLITTAGAALIGGMNTGGIQQFPTIQGGTQQFQQPQQPGQFQPAQQPGQMQQPGTGAEVVPGAPMVTMRQADMTAAAWWTFIAMLLGGGAAIAGGWIGAPATHLSAAGRRRTA
jgi:hypothetical protein